MTNGERKVNRYQEGTDLVGFHHIKFAILIYENNPRVMYWTLFITPNEIMQKNTTKGVLNTEKGVGG
ncbi:hypothetical protein D3C79_1095920 [compost metagenome]